MNKSESITNLVSAVLKVMAEVKGIDKTLNVGTGNNSYKGVADKDVKNAIGGAMEKNGLSIFPIDISESVEVSEWDETYNGQSKRRQQVFTKVKTTYLLAHQSGEWMQIMGMGHGIDSQDKSAGKATTYALKYALLYTFMIPTGKIDDADVTHSDAIEPAKVSPQQQAVKYLRECKTIDQLKDHWETLTEEERADVEVKRECNRIKAQLSLKQPQ